MVYDENEEAVNQLRADMPLSINRKRALRGYFLMFSPLYLLMLACFFFPAHQAWIVPYIPLFVYTIIVIMLTKHTVENLGFKVKSYNRIHILLYLGIFIGGFCIRMFIMNPWLKING